MQNHQENWKSLLWKNLSYGEKFLSSLRGSTAHLPTTIKLKSLKVTSATSRHVSLLGSLGSLFENVATDFDENRKLNFMMS